MLTPGDCANKLNFSQGEFSRVDRQDSTIVVWIFSLTKIQLYCPIASIPPADHL